MREYLEHTVLDSGEIVVEDVTPEEYNMRLVVANKFHRKDKNSIGHCYLRKYIAMKGLPEII